MGPHVTSNTCKGDDRKTRSGASDIATTNLRRRTSRSVTPDLIASSTSSTYSCTTPVHHQKSTKIDKTAEARTSRRRSQRGGARSCGEIAIVGNCIGDVSNANAAAGNIEKPPNAAVCDIMAPALTEPLSPTEKLSSSTAKATPSTRSSKRVNETSVTASSSGSSINNSGREKRSRHTSTSISSTPPIPSTSARVTRSKDAYQRVFEQAVSPTNISPLPTAKEGNTSGNVSSAAPESTSPNSSGDASSASPGCTEQTKTVLNNNEPMGLSAVLHNNNNNNNRNNNSKGIDDVKISLAASASEVSVKSGTNINNIPNPNSKSNSTEQLLADLTDDFEEAITAEICLRKQLKESNLSKDATSDTTSASPTTTSQPKDILVIKAGGSVTTGKTSQTQLQLQHMESSQSSCGKDDDTTTLTTELQTVDRTVVTSSVGHITAADTTQQTSTDGTKTILLSSPVAAATVVAALTQQNEEMTQMMVSPATTSERVHTTVQETELVTQIGSSQKHESTRLQILSVEELPPISTDSTMTASEVEDNLEERLSQLDGTAIASPACDQSNIVSVIGTIPATPPRTPTKQHLQQLHQQQVQQLQQQLQQTPPTPLSQQVHQHQLAQNAFTPQSSSSSMNTLSSTNLPPAFMKETAAGELEDHDIEEVLKVLKGFDGGAGADTLCDLNVLFNEVYTLNYEEVSSQPTSTTTKPNPLKDIQCEIERKQQSMQRKIDFLLRRVRKIQARYMNKHTSEEVAGLFEWSSRMVAGKVGAIVGGGRDGDEENATTLLRENVIAARPLAISWIEEKKNPVPSSQMVAMLRRLEAASNAQQLCTAVTVANTVHTNSNLRKGKKAAMLEMQAMASTSIATPSSSFSSGADRKGETVVGTFDANIAEEITHVAGLLQTEMREVQTAIDSDATESSSGGESADEMVTYSNQIQQPLSIGKRAAWRYSRDRAVIASRWAWLLSQIADLEIRIRQHGELHQEIVRTKGVVACSLEEQFLPGVTKPNEIGAAITASSSVNGYKGSMNMLGGSAMSKSEMSAEELGLPGSCRTRGYIPTQFRKRKLFQTTNIHTISKKAARTSTIKCGCQWPLQPCALCTGRSDPTAPRDPPDTMMMADRVALLDAGYHPVLSFPEDIHNALHLEAIARMPEWQQRVMRCQVKSIAKSIWKAEREAAAAAGHHTSKKYGEHSVKRRYIKKKNRLATEDKNAAVNATNASPSAAAAAAATTTTSTGDGATGSPQTTSATPAAATTLSSDAGNGIGNLSTSTTPLVANKLTKNAKKLHYHLVGDGVLLEPPLSPVATNHSGVSQSSHHSTNSGNSNYIHQTSDYPPQNYDPYNPNPAHSSLISSSNSNGIGGGSNNLKYNNYKHRKSSTTAAAAAAGTAGASSSSSSNMYNNQNSNYHYSNNSQCYNNVNNNSEFNFLHTNDNWDGFAARSRNSSPTHGSSSSNYHKYERSKNRTSYDIDNIVIPYSVAAATRVEILPYKEIPTPKWRVIELAERERERALNSASGADKPKEEEVVNTVDSASTKEDKPDDVGGNDATEAPSKVQCNAVVVTEPTTVVTGDVVEQQTTEAVAKTVLESKVGITEKRNNNVLKQNNVAVKLQDDALLPEKPTEIEQVAQSNNAAEPFAKKPKLDCSTVNEISRRETEMDTSAQVDVKAANAAATIEATETAPLAVFITMPVEKPRARRLVRSATVDADDGALEEDISDEALMQRHERALAEERRKFQTYLKFPWSTRSRANRRIDSRAESSGANTPDPTSPAPQTPSVGGGDQESIPSPLAPSTPLNPLDAIPEAGESAPIASTANCSSKRLERRRTTSTKKERELERRSSTPDPKELVPPYEPLKFPLTDEALDGLMKAMPVEFHYLDDSKYLEDCNNIVVRQYTRNRSNWRSDSTVRRGPGKATTHNYCDANNKRQRINNSAANSRRGYYGSGIGGSRQQRLTNCTRGKDIMQDDGEDEEDADESMHEADDDDVDMVLDEDDDDYDYPKHHLAPDDDLYENAADGVMTRGGGANGIDDEYEAYVGGGHHRSLLGMAGSEGESSDTEPFADDDPNDPEWRGERDERGEKLRKSLR